MPWLRNLDEKHARHLAHQLSRNAAQSRDMAQDQLHDFAEQARDAAMRARGAAEPALHQAADFARHEGQVVAEAVAEQAVRAGRAVRNDPVPVIVGLVGLALLASLLMTHRRH